MRVAQKRSVLETLFQQKHFSLSIESFTKSFYIPQHGESKDPTNKQMQFPLSDN